MLATRFPLAIQPPPLLRPRGAVAARVARGLLLLLRLPRQVVDHVEGGVDAHLAQQRLGSGRVVAQARAYQLDERRLRDRRARAARVAVQRERVRQKGAAPATHTPDRVSAAAEGATQSGV